MRIQDAAEMFYKYFSNKPPTYHHPDGKPGAYSMLSAYVQLRILPRDLLQLLFCLVSLCCLGAALCKRGGTLTSKTNEKSVK